MVKKFARSKKRYRDQVKSERVHREKWHLSQKVSPWLIIKNPTKTIKVDLIKTNLELYHQMHHQQKKEKINPTFKITI